MSAMQKHEMRLDHSGHSRSIEPEKSPLIYSPHGDNLSLEQSYEAHVEGAAQSKGASNLMRHAFIQFPTTLEITPNIEKMMLREAAAFIDKTHGGRAVFRARLDRDEKGKHGVDVFFAPRYEKTTAKGSQDWVSLTKFGKAMARQRLPKRQEEKLNKKTNTWEPQLNSDGTPKMVWQDSAYFQGQVLQDLWFEHLRDVAGLDWVVRGEKKIGRDADRVEAEEYGLQQDREKLAEREAALKLKEAEILLREKAIEDAEEAAEQEMKENLEHLENTLSLVDQGLKYINADEYYVELTSEHFPDDEKHSFEEIKEYQRVFKDNEAPNVSDLLYYKAFHDPVSCTSRSLGSWVEEATSALFEKLDEIAAWMREAKLGAAQALTDAQAASQSLLDASKAQSDQIIATAREKGDKLASVDVGIKTYAALHEVLMETMQSNLHKDDFDRVMIPARKKWNADPRNPMATKPASVIPGLG
jgi:hypothetical protein